MLSTWHSNQHRHNPSIDQFWSAFYLVYQSHFYHVGGKESNRKPMLEAVVMNYTPPQSDTESSVAYQQSLLWAGP
jgi:DNA adenine methylase